MNKRLLALSCAACMIASGVEAATLGAIQGNVLVNRGGGYETVRGAMNLKPGDTVMAQAGGSAQIVYPDGCVVPVEVGAVVAVGEASPCLNLGRLELPEIPKEFLIGVGAVGAVAGATIIWEGSDNDEPVSK
jgi:hypothetical protein